MPPIITQVIERVNTKVIHSSDEIVVMETVGQRLKRLRESKGLSQGALAAQAGLKSQGTIGNIERETRGYGDSVVDIARVLGVTPDYLRCSDAAGTGAISNATMAPIGARRVPVISAIQAGLWGEIVDQFQPGDADDWLLTDLELSPSSFALTIRGDSMLPEFREGDRVIIDPDVLPHPGDFVAAKNSAQEATFKKYRPRGMDAAGHMVFELVPLNDDYPTLRSDVDHIRIVGTMVEHRKYRRAR